MSLFDSASLICTPNGVKAGKLYSIKPSDGAGDLDVVRATSATRVNANGLIESVGNNIARLDYSNGSCPSILVEPQRTNLLLYSEKFDDESWLNDNSTENANATNSPSGLNDAYSLIENTATNQHSIYKIGVSVSSGAVVTLSFFAKQNTRKFIGVNDPYTGNGAFFDLENGTALGDIGTISSKVIENYGNGWYRCSVTFQASGTLTGGQIFISPNGITGIYTGDGTSGVFVWGAQLEAGSYPTSYIPTLGAAVTRNADLISKTGISSLIGQTEGTLFAEFVINSSSAPNMAFFVSAAGVFDNAIWIQQSASDSVIFRVFSGTSQQCLITKTGLTNGQTVKVAGAYKANDFVLYVNGVQVGTDNSGSIPSSLSQLEIGTYAEVGSPYNQNRPISQALLFKTRLSNAQLATLTSL